MSSDTQANPNGPMLKNSVYPSISSIPEGVQKAVGNTPYMDIQIIPIDATMGYESLTHKVAPTSSSYFNVDDAYPSVSKGTCTQFVLRKCDGVVEQQYITDQLVSSKH